MISIIHDSIIARNTTYNAVFKSLSFQLFKIQLNIYVYLPIYIFCSSDDNPDFAFDM